MESDIGRTIPVTVRNVQINDGRYIVLFFEESLGPEGVNRVYFPRGWRGDTKWAELKCRNFKRLLSTPGKRIDIEVDEHFTLVRVADDTQEYFIVDEDDDEWGSFAAAAATNTTSTNTNTTSTCSTTTYREEDQMLWGDVPTSKKQKTSKRELITEPSPGFEQKARFVPKKSSSFKNEPISLCIGIAKGSSEYKKVLHLKEESTYATIEFFARLIEMHPEDAKILQSMLKEFDDDIDM